MRNAAAFTSGLFCQIIACGCDGAVFTSFRAALESEIRAGLGESIDDSAMHQALDAVPLCFESGPLGSYIRRLNQMTALRAHGPRYSSVSPDRAAEDQLWLLLMMDDDPENICGDLRMTGASPDLLMLYGDVIKARLKRGRPALDGENLPYQMCIHWPGNLHRASLAAGCALMMAKGIKLRTLSYASYKKQLRRVGLRPPAKPEITLGNVGDYDQAALAFTAELKRQSAADRGSH